MPLVSNDEPAIALALHVLKAPHLHIDHDAVTGGSAAAYASRLRVQEQDVAGLDHAGRSRVDATHAVRHRLDVIVSDDLAHVEGAVLSFRRQREGDEGRDDELPGSHGDVDAVLIASRQAECVAAHAQIEVGVQSSSFLLKQETR